MRELHRLWLNKPHHKITEHHSRLLGLEKYLHSRRTNCNEHLPSIRNIYLPFPFEAVITEYPIRWANHAAVVYVDSKAAVDDYATTYRIRTFTNVPSSTNLSEGAQSSGFTEPS